MSALTGQWTHEAGEDVLRQMRSAKLRLQPGHVTITDQVDALGENAWCLLLALPAPEGGTWDRAEVSQVRRAAAEVSGRLAAAAGHELPGASVASVTTDEASPEDIAEDGAPGPGEDPGR